MMALFESVSIEQVKDFWDDRPCNIRHLSHSRWIWLTCGPCRQRLAARCKQKAIFMEGWKLLKVHKELIFQWMND